MRYTRKNIYRRLNKNLYLSKSSLFCCMLFPVCITAISAVSPYLYKTLLDDVMTKGNIERLYVIIPAMAVIYAIKTIFIMIHASMNINFSNQTGTVVKRKLMERFLYRDINTIFDEQVGQSSSNLEKDESAVYDFLSRHMAGAVTGFIATAIYLLLMLQINLWLGMLSMILVPVACFFSWAIGKRYNEINKERFEVRAQTKTHLFDTIRRWREIKFNTLEERFAAQYDERLEPERRLNRKWMHYYGLEEFMYIMKTEFVMKALIYFVGGLLIIVKHITIGELLMFTSYMESMYTCLDSLMKSNSVFIGQKAVYDRLFAILEEQDSRRPMMCPFAPTIELKGVTHSYEASQQKTFETTDFTFDWGKKYLLVGKSGAGKSTLIKLILGMVQPQRGEVSYNHIPIENIDSQSLFQCIGAVMQENTFFNLTIRENLLLVAPDATEEELMQGLQAACLDEFIHSLPQKLDTVIGERGIKLSGGQKQRLAIARIILHHAQIVILDEATNALDSLTESKVMENLSGYFAGKTMIVIAHRALIDYQYDYSIRIDNQEIATCAV